VWSVTSGPELTTPRPVAPAGATVAVASPLGRFEVREEAGMNGRALTLVKRADGTSVRSTRGTSLHSLFSSDERWLAVWNQDGVQVHDLARGEIAWSWGPSGVQPVDLTRGNDGLERQVAVRDVSFEGRNTLLKVQLPDSTTLIPLDRDLMERFAKWLVSRPLDDRERCRYLDEEDACRRQGAGARETRID